MTLRQQELITEFDTNLRVRVIEFLDKAWDCHCAIVDLPHTGEDGKPVLHRDNLAMIHRRNRYYQAAYSLVDWSLDDMLYASDPERWRRYNILRKAG